jgi:hypothetical protein
VIVNLSQFWHNDMPEYNRMLQFFFKSQTIQIALVFREINSQNTKNSRGLWKIESTNYFEGGSIAAGEPVRLKNINNNMYLSVKRKSEVKDLDPFEMD